MQIAVTGGSGFIGRYIIRQLVNDGHSLRCWFRAARPATGGDHSHVEWIPGDLESPESMVRLTRGCDAVVHAAFWRPGSGFRGAEGDIARFAEINIVGTLRLIEAARDAGVQRFVYLSSCAVHEIILDDRPLDEAHPLWATSHYGAHKAAVEKFVHSFGMGQGFNICALRPTGVYGVADPVADSKWFGLVQRVVAGQDVSVQGGGKEVHAADVARAVSLLLGAAGTAGQAFNCYDRYVSQFEVATVAEQMAGSGSRIIGQPQSPRHEISTARLRSLGMEFGGVARLHDTIRELVQVIRKS